MANTFDDYILAVKSKYEVEKSKVYSDFLLKPSPAQIRELCLLIYDKGLSNKDKEVFELFFQKKPDSSLRKAIENIDVEKFRKICNFLNRKSQSTGSNSLNLIAILVNYEFRPFSLFLSSDLIKVEEKNETNKRVDEVEDTNKENDTEKPKSKTKIKNKIAIVFLGLLGLTSIGYTAKKLIAPEPQCMQWQNNHYEVVDCNNNKKGFVNKFDIIPFDESQSKLVKIKVSDTTIFFKNGKPLYWYCKVNGNLEFFNTHGVHPETGKALKQVSKYMIEKYIKLNKQNKNFN